MESHRKTLQLEMVTENADGTGVYFAVTELPAMKGQIQDALQRLRTADQAERFRDVSIRECPPRNCFSSASFQSRHFFSSLP